MANFKCETVAIESKDSPCGYVIVNAGDEGEAKVLTEKQVIALDKKAAEAAAKGDNK